MESPRSKVDAVEGDDVALAGEVFGDAEQVDHRGHRPDYVNDFTILSNFLIIKLFSRPHWARCSNPSRATEADRHLLAVDDHRHGAAAVAKGQHPRQRGGVLLHVEVFERNLPPLKILTGGLRVGSRVFAEDVNHG